MVVVANGVKLFLGIDWAAEKHDACIRWEDGIIVAEFTFAETSQGYELLRDKVRAAIGATEGVEVVCAIETSHGLLVNFLLEQGWVVYPLNPKSVDRYRDRLRTARNKNDQLDAWLMTDILRTDRDLHRPLLPDSEVVQELRELTRGRQDLVQESVRLGNQLQACLKAYWPESLLLSAEVADLWFLEFLAQYPNLEEARKASVPVLQAFLKACRHPQWRQKAEELQVALKAPNMPSPAHVVRARSRQALHLVRQLRTVRQDLKAYDKEIERLLRSHPDGQLFLSLPGAGPTLAARLLAEIGDNRARYATANSLQCEAGTAPVTQRSGKTLFVVRFRRACKKQLRHALHLFALCSISRSTWARQLYDLQRLKGSGNAEALRVVAHKWLKIIFAMRVSKSHYDEQRFLAAKNRFDQKAA